MNALFIELLNDEAGFIVSAELILISTIAVLSLVVGLAEVSYAINTELQDVAQAFSAVNSSPGNSGRNDDWGRGRNGQGHSGDDDWAIYGR